MTHEDAGNYGAKHLPSTKLGPKIAEAVKRKIVNGRITCPAAHRIAHELEVLPADVGMAVDLLEVQISKCQLGLFGYGPQGRMVKPSESVVPELEEAIKKSVVNNRISCFSCWEIAERFSIPKMDVSATCETLRIKISSCQLGCFR